MCNFISKLVYCSFLSSVTYREYTYMGNKLPLFFTCLKIPEINISWTELKKLEFEHIRIFFFFCLLFVVCSLIFIWIVKYKHKFIMKWLIFYLFTSWKMKKVKNSCLLIKKLLCPNVSQYYQDILKKNLR